MTTTASKRFAIRKRLAISFLVVASIIILLGLLGYFWLPGYAKSRIESILSDTLHRPVTVQSIEIHLYSLEVTVNGFRVGEKGAHADANETFFFFEKLHVDLSIDSVMQRAPVISEITLHGPTLRLVREGENQFNITDLVTEFSQPSDDEGKKGETKFSVSNIVIEGGYFELIDQFKESHQKISDINLGIPFVANFESSQAYWVEPYLSAMVNGSPFLLDGKLRPFTDKREATLALKFKDIDLTSIDEYSPIPTGIHLLSGYFDSDLQIKFSQIIDEPPRITLSGKTALRQVAIKNQAVEMPYQATLDILYIQLNDINLTGQKPSTAAIALKNAALTREGDFVPVLSLPNLTVKDIEIDIAQQQIVLDELLLDRFNASIRREKGGNIDLTRLFAARPQQASIPETPRWEEKVIIPLPAQKPWVAKIQQASIPIPGKKPLVAASTGVASEETITDTAFIADSPKQAAKRKQSWTTQINLLKLTASSFHFEDTTLSDVPPMDVDSLDLTLADIDLTGKNPLDITLQAKINQHGSIDAKGSLAWAPLATDLTVDLKAVDLVALQGWAVGQFNALLTRGAISFQGKIKAGGEPLKILVNGDGQFLDFNIFDKVSASDLLRWENLDVNGINFVNEPLRVDISSIKLGNFFARVIILPEGDLNLSQIARQDGKAAPPPVEQVKSTQPATAETMPLRIDQVILQQGNVNFNDRFIKPNYRANLTGLSGKIGPVHPGKMIKIEIHGAVDKSAPLEILGSFNPFGSEMQLDIKAKAHDLDMPAFSPYSGKLAGYPIEKGKLSVDIHYLIEAGALKAENNVFLDQLDLGEQIDSPDVPSLPLDLAVTLLKNQQGEIDINLPIQGSIDDPQFSLGGIIFDAFINLIMKAITSPFALLGSVLEDGEELSTINFSAGQARIETEAEKRLQTLSQVLTERPSLKLEITGYTDPAKDYEGLKQVILERKIKALKLTEDAQKGVAGGSLEAVALEPEEYEEYLTFIYEEEDFEKPKNFFGFTKSLPVPEMEQLILAQIEISDEQMQALAEQRAKAARSWLIEQGGIASERIFLLGGKNESELKDEARGSQVEFSLM